MLQLIATIHKIGMHQINNAKILTSYRCMKTSSGNNAECKPRTQTRTVPCNSAGWYSGFVWLYWSHLQNI